MHQAKLFHAAGLAPVCTVESQSARTSDKLSAADRRPMPKAKASAGEALGASVIDWAPCTRVVSSGAEIEALLATPPAEVAHRQRACRAIFDRHFSSAAARVQTLLEAISLTEASAPRLMASHRSAPSAKPRT